MSVRVTHPLSVLVLILKDSSLGLSHWLCQAGVFQTPLGNVSRISPHLSLLAAHCCSLKHVLRCCRSTGMVGMYRYSFHYQPATFSTVYFEFLDYTYHKKPNIHTPPGFLDLQSTCSPHLLGLWVILLHSVLSLYGFGGWMNETRAWSPHSSCWDCSCNFRAFRVSVNLPRNPVLKLAVYSAERLMLKIMCNP